MEGPKIRPDSLRTVPRFRVTAKILVHSEDPRDVLQINTLENTFNWTQMTATQHVAAIKELLDGGCW